MPRRVTVSKTWKLFIGGAFPRSESGRTLPVSDGKGRVIGRVCRASRKDLREAVEAARGAFPAWTDTSGYLRGQILYRMAEMLEGRADEFTAALRAPGGRTPAAARREVADTIDRLVRFAGWTDKFGSILGCHNPVAGSYYNFTVAEPTGIVGVVAPDDPPLLALVTLLAAPVCAGNTVVAIASEANPLPAALLGEVMATSDLPPGVINLLTGRRRDLLEHLASHRQVNAISAADLPRKTRTLLRLGAAENVKRVTVVKVGEDAWRDDDAVASPWSIEPFVEMKTIWQPSAT